MQAKSLKNNLHVHPIHTCNRDDGRNLKGRSDDYRQWKLLALAFGGVDLIVNNAGLSISKTIGDHTEKDWDLLYDVLVKGQFFVTQAAVAVMKKQNIGGDIINIVSRKTL